MESNEVCQNPEAILNKLDVNQDTKTTIKSIIDEFKKTGGYKLKKSKNNRLKTFNKTRSKRLKKGGGCETAKYILVIGSIILALIGVYNCFETSNSDYYQLVVFTTTQFRQSIINLFNIADNFANVQSGKMNTLQAILESFGKLNLLNTALEKMTAYYTRLKNSTSGNITDIIPKPLSNFLDIFCNLEKGKLDLQKAKEEAKTQLELNTTVKEIQEILPVSKSETGPSNEIVRKEGNTIVIENVNSDQIIKLDIKVMKRDDDITDENFYDVIECDPSKQKCP